MTPITLADADALHSCYVQGSVSWEPLEHAGFEQFSLDVAAFLRDASGREDHHTISACRELKAIRSAFTISVEPFSRCGERISPRLRILEHSASIMKTGFGEDDPAVSRLEQALSSLDELGRSAETPLGDMVADIASRHPSGRVALVCPKASAVATTQEFFGGHVFAPQLDVVAPSELAKHPAFSVIIVLGTPYWYRGNEHVLTVPRAEHVHMMHWSWVNSAGLPERAALVGGRSGADQPGSAPSPPAARRNAPRVDEQEVAEVTDWVYIRERRPPDAPRDGRDDVEALLFLLAGDRAVYLDALSKKQEVVEPDLDGEERVQKKDTDGLAPGDHILLRTEGGGRLVRVAADALLGSRATFLRDRQSEWKRHLRGKIDELGFQRLEADLRVEGCTIASYQNIRNWAAPDSIKLMNEDHFLALLRVIGLDRPSEYWEWMKEIDSAHRKAGRVLASQLREAVRDADVDPLVRFGRMKFSLGDGEGGEMEAFRIEDADAEPHVVPEQLLGQPFFVHAGDAGAENDGDEEG